MLCTREDMYLSEQVYNLMDEILMKARHSKIMDKIF